MQKPRRSLLIAAALVGAVTFGVYLERAQSAANNRDPYKFFDTLVDLRAQILRNYVEPVEDQKLLKGAVNGMLGELDQYSNYFTKEELAAFDRATRGQFSGIGAEIAQDPQTGVFTIVTPMEDSPALKAGILAGDRILKVNGESLEGFSLKDLIGRISGPPDSQVKLTVVHEGDKNPVELTITRAAIQVKSIKGVRHTGDGADAGAWDYMLVPEHRIAYVRLTNFMDNTADELDNALLPLINSKQGLRGIILDLRFNPGGLLSAGIDVSDRFLESGTIVSTRKPGGKNDFIAEAKKEGTYPRVPVVVLVNEYSASAAEIVAGALKDHNRAVLIGTRTFGKGSVQNLITLDNGNAALKLTTQYYYLPSGRNIAKRKDSDTWGVDPEPAFNIPLSDAENRAILQARSRSEVIRKKPTTTVPATQVSTQPNTETGDRQLARAVEVLIAYQAFTGEKPVAAEVQTTRPSVTVTVPPATEPASQPASAPATTPATQPATIPDTPPAPPAPPAEPDVPQ